MYYVLSKVQLKYGYLTNFSIFILLDHLGSARAS